MHNILMSERPEVLLATDSFCGIWLAHIGAILKLFGSFHTKEVEQPALWLSSKLNVRAVNGELTAGKHNLKWVFLQFHKNYIVIRLAKSN